MEEINIYSSQKQSRMPLLTQSDIYWVKRQILYIFKPGMCTYMSVKSVLLRNAWAVEAFCEITVSLKHFMK